jgi:hypothetical protein
MKNGSNVIIMTYKASLAFEYNYFVVSCHLYIHLCNCWIVVGGRDRMLDELPVQSVYITTNVVNEKDTIGHIFTGQYYGLHNHSVLCWILYIISIEYYSEVSDMVMVFNATFNYISVISWRSILLMEETGVPVKNHRPTASHWQTLLL